MTLIEIKPHRWGWKVFEAPGVEPVFPEKDQAIDYAQGRACFRSSEIQVFWFERRSTRLIHVFVCSRTNALTCCNVAARSFSKRKVLWKNFPRERPDTLTSPAAAS